MLQDLEIDDFCISIHALREEGDVSIASTALRTG